MAKTYTVHEVLFDAYAPGPAGDGTHTRRFSGRNLTDAQAFAEQNTCYGKPAAVWTRTDVPARLAQRWGVAS